MRVSHKLARGLRGHHLSQSEAAIFFSPLASFFSIAWKNAHFIIIGIVAAYSLSGTTFIEANQAGVVLRFGEVTHEAGEPKVHRSGLLFALPHPFDEVLVVDVDRVNSITIDELSHPRWQLSPNQISNATAGDSASIDPDQYGYILTGDRNIIHTRVIVRYLIRDPVAYNLLTFQQTLFLRSAILESTVRIGGKTRLDDLLGGDRDLFSRAVAVDAQERLDRIDVGIEIVSVEYENLKPPEQVTADFDAVQSAYIEAETRVRDARAYAAKVLPDAKASAGEIITHAEAVATSYSARARADRASFMSLLESYRENPDLVRQRIYREGLEQALHSVAQLNFVPAPVESGYEGTRFSISLSRTEDRVQSNKVKLQPPVGSLTSKSGKGQKALMTDYFSDGLL